MSKAKVSLSAVTTFRKNADNEKVVADALNATLGSIDKCVAEILKERQKIDVAMTKTSKAIISVGNKISIIKNQIAKLEDKLAVLKSKLAATKPTITVTHTEEIGTDEEGNPIYSSYTTEEPNPEYVVIENEIASVESELSEKRAKLAKAESIKAKLEATKAGMQKMIETLDTSKKELLTAKTSLQAKINQISKCSASATSSLSKAEKAIQKYLNEKVKSRTGGAALNSDSVGASIFGNFFNRDKNIKTELKGVEFNPIREASIERTEQQIISSVSGGDMTEGSCSSLALAYAGNKAGYVVYDFRGGQSRSVFSSRDSIRQIASMKGVSSIMESGINDTECAERLMSKMEKGHEYYMATGRHAAVVRLSNEGHYQYLELQSEISSDNGWQPLTLRALYERFGCEDRHKTEWSNYLINIETLQNNKEFLNLLGYINTDKIAQKKGVYGHVR